MLLIESGYHLGRGNLMLVSMAQSSGLCGVAVPSRRLSREETATMPL